MSCSPAGSRTRCRGLSPPCSSRAWLGPSVVATQTADQNDSPSLPPASHWHPGPPHRSLTAEPAEHPSRAVLPKEDPSSGSLIPHNASLFSLERSRCLWDLYRPKCLPHLNGSFRGTRGLLPVTAIGLLVRGVVPCLLEGAMSVGKKEDHPAHEQVDE